MTFTFDLVMWFKVTALCTSLPKNTLSIYAQVGTIYGLEKIFLERSDMTYILTWKLHLQSLHTL